MIPIGRMRQRVTIQAPRETQSPSGETSLVWDIDLGTVWGSVDGLSTRDFMQCQQANVVATHRIRIRYRDDINQTHRIVWRGRTMELASVFRRDQHLEMLAREVQ
jgi:SPP1 family predicted phage head-tail adaptor